MGAAAENVRTRQEKTERGKSITSNACTASNFDINVIRNPNSYPFKWSNSINNSIFRPKENRHNNIILFGVKHSTSESSEEAIAMDKVSVINIFNALGILITIEAFDCQRLQPKRNQPEPHPILVKLIPEKANIKALYVVKMAKNLKDLNDYKHISISLDLFKEQRMVQKKLILVRKELNKQLREEIPNSAYYFSIDNGRIIKKSKYEEVSEECKKCVSNLISEAISEIKSEQTKSFSSASIITMPLLNKVIEARMLDVEHKKIVTLAERITRNVIKNLNNQFNWPERKRLAENSTDVLNLPSMSNEKNLSNAHTDALNLQNRLRIEKIEEAVEGTLSIIKELKDLTIISIKKTTPAFKPIVELIKCTNERIDTHNKQIFDLLSV